MFGFKFVEMFRFLQQTYLFETAVIAVLFHTVSLGCKLICQLKRGEKRRLMKCVGTRE
jgi:hypothetical protein